MLIINAVYPPLLSKLCLKDQRKIYSINTYCLSVTTGLDKLLIKYNLVNLGYKNYNTNCYLNHHWAYLSLILSSSHF